MIINEKAKLKNRKVSAGSDFNLEKKLFKKGYRVVIGIDEAGRGPLAGPVVAAATTVRNDQFPMTNFQSNPNDQIFNDPMWDLVRDSKKLSAKQREGIFDFIQENFYVGVGLCDHKTVDRINILEASFLAMKKAVADLQKNLKHKKEKHSTCHSRLACPLGVARDRESSHKSKFISLDSRFRGNDKSIIILVDGNKKIPNLSMEQMAVVGGDRIVKSISAASIIAKVTRDRIMLNMHKKYPQYQFDKHKGYGTKLHFATLQKNGPCEIHRKSFSPVRKLVKGDF
jgi:ribonuclease HII